MECKNKKSIPLWSVSAMISMIIIIVILISYIYQVKQWMPETKNIIGTFSYQDVDGTKEYIVFDREERCYFYKSGEYIDKGEYVWERTDKNSADIVVITDIGEKAGTKEVLFFDNKLYFFSQAESKFVIFEKENDVPTFAGHSLFPVGHPDKAGTKITHRNLFPEFQNFYLRI